MGCLVEDCIDGLGTRSISYGLKQLGLLEEVDDLYRIQLKRINGGLIELLLWNLYTNQLIATYHVNWSYKTRSRLRVKITWSRRYTANSTRAKAWKSTATSASGTHKSESFRRRLALVKVIYSHNPEITSREYHRHEKTNYIVLPG